MTTLLQNQIASLVAQHGVEAVQRVLDTTKHLSSDDEIIPYEFLTNGVGPVTRGELSAAFKRVANPDNWKMPIDRIVELDDASKNLVAAAVTFYTGSVASFTAMPENLYRVKADGYYKAIGA